MVPKTGRITRPELLEAKDKRLQAEIALEREKAKTPKPAEQELPEAKVRRPKGFEDAPSQ